MLWQFKIKFDKWPSDLYKGVELVLEGYVTKGATLLSFGSKSYLINECCTELIN